jgi:hypothetical protein
MKNLISRTMFVVFAGTLVLANAAGAQTGPCAVPTGPLLPDLIIDQHLLATQIFVSEEQFTPTSCTVAEGVVDRPGKQVLLRFNSSSPNIGDAALTIGDPSQCVGTLFHFSECHQHLHFEDYAAYRLWTEAGYANWLAMRDPGAPANSGVNAQLLAAAVAAGDLISGHKQGFCMVDSAPYPGPTAQSSPQYLSCSSNQGISVGWEDIYAPQLPDQFIPITGLREGTYVLENQVNPDQILPEKTFSNNDAAVKIYYTPRHGNTPATAVVVP